MHEVNLRLASSDSSDSPTVAMHFASLILALSTAVVASATPIAKRTYFYPTFYNYQAATEAPDYITYQLVATIPGKPQTLFVLVVINLVFQTVSRRALPSRAAPSSIVSQLLISRKARN